MSAATMHLGSSQSARKRIADPSAALSDYATKSHVRPPLAEADNQSSFPGSTFDIYQGFGCQGRHYAA